MPPIKLTDEQRHLLYSSLGQALASLLALGVDSGAIKLKKLPRRKTR